MKQPAPRIQSDVTRAISTRQTSYPSRLGSLVDTVLRGLDRIFGGLARPALEPVPARVPSSGSRPRA